MSKVIWCRFPPFLFGKKNSVECITDDDTHNQSLKLKAAYMKNDCKWILLSQYSTTKIIDQEVSWKPNVLVTQLNSVNLFN